MQIPQSKLSEREIAEAWAKITIQLLRKNLTRMKIGQNSSGDLFRSFKYNVTNQFLAKHLEEVNYQYMDPFKKE